MSRFLVGQSGPPDINTRLPLCCGKGILNFLVDRRSYTLTSPCFLLTSIDLAQAIFVHDKTVPPPAMFQPKTPTKHFFVAAEFLGCKTLNPFQ